MLIKIKRGRWLFPRLYNTNGDYRSGGSRHHPWPSSRGPSRHTPPFAGMVLGRVSSPPSLSCFFVLFSHAIFCNEECYGKLFQQSPNVDWGSHGYG